VNADLQPAHVLEQSAGRRVWTGPEHAARAYQRAHCTGQVTRCDEQVQVVAVPVRFVIVNRCGQRSTAHDEGRDTVIIERRDYFGGDLPEAGRPEPLAEYGRAEVGEHIAVDVQLLSCY
jgi:hypothetical protein